MTYQLELKTAYTNSSEMTTYKMPIDQSVISGIKTKVNAINTSLTGGTSDGMDTFFVAPDIDDLSTGGTLSRIAKATLITTDENILF